MQFIRLPKLMDFAERELPEQVADWTHMESLQNIQISFVQKLWVNIQVSLVMEWSER
jgi:hypothetical protein